MTKNLLYGLSTQRFDLKNQISLGLVGSDTLAPEAHSDSSFLSLEQSLTTLREPPNNYNRLSRVLSSISSILSNSQWHEGSSTGVSILATTLFSRDSHNTSTTSFNLNDSPKSLDEGRCTDTLEVEEPLTQSPTNAKQVDAHVPPSPTPLKSRFSDYSDLIDNDDESIGEICFVSSSRTAEFNKTLVPMSTVSESLPWYQAFCKAHPEYDSEYDRDTDTTGSILTLPLAPAEDKAEPEAGRDFHETSASNVPIPDPGPLPYSILSEITTTTTTPLLLSPLPTPSSCYVRPCTSSANAAPLLGINEKESNHIQQASSIPINAMSLLKDVPVAPSAVNCPSWWAHGSEGSGSENKVIGEIETKNPDKETQTSRTHDRVASETYGQRSSRTKSGIRTFLSIILPCIPVVTKETKRINEKDGCRVQQDGARGPGITMTGNDSHLTRAEKNHGKKAVRKKSCTTLYW